MMFFQPIFLLIASGFQSFFFSRKGTSKQIANVAKREKAERNETELWKAELFFTKLGFSTWDGANKT